MTLARGQQGLLTSTDLESVTGRGGELRRRVRTGTWHEVLPGVLAPANLDVSVSQLASAAMLWEPTALLSHHEAARRAGFWTPDPDRLRDTVAYESPRRSLKRLEVVRTRHLPTAVATDGFHRWTHPARTVVDLAMLLTRKQLEAVLLSAIRNGRTSAEEVEREAARLPGRAGLADLRAVTQLWSPERESLLEDVLYDDVTAVVHERVVRQLEICARSGQVLARVDCAIPELRIAFEADGLLFHSTDEQIAADQARDRRILKVGWPTVRFREGTLDDRVAVRREIASIVDRRRRDLRAS
jgi:very-short-patch-repair endonuclease